MFGLDTAVDIGRWFNLNALKPSAIIQRVSALSWLFMTDRFWRDMGETQRWKNLDDATWARKKSDKMLVESGEYYASWERRFRDVNETSIESKSKLAVFHELGTKNMPERSWVWLSEDEVGTIARDIADLMEAAIDRD